MRKLMVLPAAILAAFLVSPAHAEADANTFLQQVGRGDQTTLYVLAAYEDGFSWANVVLEKRKVRALYCPPNKLALTADQDADILRRFVKDDAAAGAMPAGLALLLALSSTFPCSTNPTSH